MRVKITGTDKDYPMSQLLYEKIELMKDRVTAQDFDTLLLLDGEEGLGKSTLAVQICYAMAQLSNREFSVKNIFFNLDDLLRFASQTKEQIMVWDEAVLGGLSTDGHNKSQKKLLKLLTVARKKNHFFIFIIPKFFRLKEQIVDRCIGLIRVYSRDGVSRGRFAYFMKDSKNSLYDSWRRTKICNYSAYYDFADTFPKCFDELIDAQIYDKKKDEAISSIVSDESEISPQKSAELLELKTKIASLTKLGLKQKDLASFLGVSPRTLQLWAKNEKKSSEQAEKSKTKSEQYNINGEDTRDFDDEDELVQG